MKSTRKRAIDILIVVVATGVSLSFDGVLRPSGLAEAVASEASLDPDPPDSHSFDRVSQQQDGRITLTSRLVNVTVTVTDSLGRLVTGLSKKHFEVYDDKVKQTVSHFSDVDVPISVGVVYDVSASMRERLTRSLRALSRFFETSSDDDDFFLMAFNERPLLVQDFTTSSRSLLGHLMFVSPKKSTALYDAVYLAVEKALQGRHPKKALLVISDGQDNHSRYSFRDVRNRARESGVLIYAIAITDPYTDSFAAYGRDLLDEIARMSGGRSFAPHRYDEAELMQICTRIALELRHQYTIGFYPSDTSSQSKWHKVKIKLKPPKGLGRLSISYKDGYQSFVR